MLYVFRCVRNSRTSLNVCHINVYVSFLRRPLPNFERTLSNSTELTYSLMDKFRAIQATEFVSLLNYNLSMVKLCFAGMWSHCHSPVFLWSVITRQISQVRKGVILNWIFITSFILAVTWYSFLRFHRYSKRLSRGNYVKSSISGIN